MLTAQQEREIDNEYKDFLARIIKDKSYCGLFDYIYWGILNKEEIEKYIELHNKFLKDNI